MVRLDSARLVSSPIYEVYIFEVWLVKWSTLFLGLISVRLETNQVESSIWRAELRCHDLNWMEEKENERS